MLMPPIRMYHCDILFSCQLVMKLVRYLGAFYPSTHSLFFFFYISNQVPTVSLSAAKSMNGSGRTVPPSNPNHFPAKLWRLANNPLKRSIFWDSKGEAVVINQQLFEREVLSPHPCSVENMDAFKTTNFSRFMRQLNLYGFRMVTPVNGDDLPDANCSTWTYYHFFNPNFKQNPGVVATLRRNTAESQQSLSAK